MRLRPGDLVKLTEHVTYKKTGRLTAQSSSPRFGIIIDIYPTGLHKSAKVMWSSGKVQVVSTYDLSLAICGFQKE